MIGQFSSEELVAAHLADPMRIPQQKLPWSSCDVQTVLKILRRNKVPLLSLVEPDGGDGLLSTPVFQTALKEEAEELAGLRAEYKKAKEALASKGITDVMIKSVGLTPSFPYRSDNLDVLYRPCDVERVKAVLRDLGYVELKNVEEPMKYLFRKFHAGRSISAIHVHAHVGWMVSFLDEETLWQRCSLSDDDPLVTVPAAEDALLITLAHYFYEDKRLALLDVLKFAHCLRRGVNWDEVYRIATWRGWRDGLNVSLLCCAYQELALYGETLAPPAVLQQASDELPRWTRTFLEHRLGISWSTPPRHEGILYRSATKQQRQALSLRAQRSNLLQYVWRLLRRFAPRNDRSPFLTQRVAQMRHGRAQNNEMVGGVCHAERNEASAAGVKEVPLRIPFVFSKIFFYTKLLRDPTRSTARRLKDLAVHTATGIKLRLRIHSQPRMLITFSGVDGSGKTTQAGALQSAFHTCHLRTSYVWSRGGSSRWVGLFSRLGRDVARVDTGRDVACYVSNKTMEDKVQSRRQRFRSPWVRWGWSWLTAIELLLQYTRRVTLPLLRGRVVICDRYIYDALAEWAAYFGEMSIEKRLAARMLRLISPRPGIAYWLDVAPEIAQSRSADGMPRDFLAAQSAACRRLASLYGVQRLDSERDWEEISDDVVYKVLSTYFADYHTLINALFLKNPGQWM